MGMSLLVTRATSDHSKFNLELLPSKRPVEKDSRYIHIVA